MLTGLQLGEGLPASGAPGDCARSAAEVEAEMA